MNTNVNIDFLYGAYKNTAHFLNSVEENKEKSLAENVNRKYNNERLPPIWADKIALAERFVIRLKNMPKDCMSFLDKKTKLFILQMMTTCLKNGKILH